MTPPAPVGLDAETRKVVADSLRQVFTSDSTARELVASVAELGWDEIVAEDPAAASTLLFGAQGAALASTPLLDDVLLSELADLLPPAEGVRAVLVPIDPAAPVAPGHPARGLLLSPLDDVHEIVVAVPHTGGVALHLVDPAAITTSPADAFDLGSAWLTAELTVPSTAPAVDDAGDAWRTAVAAGRRAVAAEIIGVCQGALDLAVAHTSTREQYGRRLASFQAVRHALSEAHAALESTRVTLDAVWADTTDPGWASSIAKIRAGATQELVFRRTVQVLGAMGMTLESDMHRFVTRAAVLDQLLGGHAQLAEEVGAALLSGAPVHTVATI